MTKRAIPPELKQIQAWLLSRRLFDDANTLSRIIGIMEAGLHLSAQDAVFFATLLRAYKAQTKRAEGWDWSRTNHKWS